MHKIIYKDKEYKSYAEIWEEYYELKCSYSAFIRYIRNHGLEKAMDHYLNKESPKFLYKGRGYNTYKEIWEKYRLKCSYVEFTKYIKNHSLEKAMDHFLNKEPLAILYKGRVYKSFKEIWRTYTLKCDYSSFVKYIKNHNLEKAINHYLPAVTVFERCKMIQDQPVQGCMKIVKQ